MFYLSGGSATGVATASLGLIVKATSAMKTLMGKLGEILVKIIEVSAKLPNPIKRKSRRHAEKRNPIISKLEDEVHSRKNKRKNEEREEDRDEDRDDNERDVLFPSVTELIQQAPNQPKRVADINMEHIFNGEVKPIKDKNGNVIAKRGTGGHYSKSPNIRITEIVDEPDVNGVVKAKIKVRDPDTGGWIKKRAPSDLFPDHWSKRQTQSEIKEAFYNSKPIDDSMWEGVSPSGVKIRGYYKIPNGDASTAWPVHGG